ncbi:transcriptional regulator [Streptomyces sp. NBC_01318]|uniref:cupin domain-containing protein n=1 Tax=Streptomyces sp. NBC_01318 TaxID=2903823 RepID=UPI002E117991|nr:transcriptional regulator [Streptomyces sp. NBC_01318]
MSLVLTTASVPDRDKVAYWNDAVSRTLVPMTVAPRGDGPFDGRIATDRLGYLQVSTMEADAERVSRTPALIARSSEALVAVGVQISGTATFIQDGRQAEVGEGDLVVYNTTRPYSFDYPQRFATHVFQLPRRTLGVPDSDIRQVTGHAIGTDDGFGAMLLPFLATLASSSADGYPPAVADRLAGNVVDLFATLIAERAHPGGTDADARSHLVLRVRDHINRNLGDPDLSPERIGAAAVGPGHCRRRHRAVGTAPSGGPYPLDGERSATGTDAARAALVQALDTVHVALHRHRG